jgi:pyruvate-ferredoxin/flavodoxin oxidoreductase
MCSPPWPRRSLRAKREQLPRVVGGRYGLSSKEFTPGMVLGIFEELARDRPRNPFTVGIIDDVSHTSLNWDPAFRPDALAGVTACVFYGLGSDGTVSANKNSIKIIAEETPNFGQGYFQYDSKKAGAVTISHLRFGARPLRGSYLVGDGEASFVACHQPIFLKRYEMLDKAAPGGIFLLNTPTPPEQVWDELPRHLQQQLIGKGLHLYVIDAYGIAERTGMGRRINTIMQTCFFAISGVLEQTEAIARIKEAVKKTYGRKGQGLLERNFIAIDATLEGLRQVPIPLTGHQHPPDQRPGANRGPGVRATGHGPPDGAQRQQPARQSHARRRYLAPGHHAL